MKLRSKITILCGGTVLLALLLGDLLVGNLLIRNIRQNTVIAEYRNVKTIEQKIIKSNMLGLDDNEKKLYLETVFKGMAKKSLQQSDIDSDRVGYIVANADTNTKIHEYYNNTTFDYNLLQGMSWTDYQDVKYVFFRWKGNEYLCINKNMERYGDFYQLTCENAMNVIIEKYLAGIVIVTIVLTIMTTVTNMLFLKKVLRPLGELNDTTKKMADSDYSCRVDVKGSDEIAQLGDNFNKMAQAIDKRTKSLEESEYKKTLFMGNLTHELRTPMTAMLGYSELLLTTKLDDDDREEALRYINEECRRLSKLSDKMMSLLTLNDDTELIMQNITAKQLFREVHTVCAKQFEQSQIILVTQEHGEIYNVEPDLFVEVLINLVDNARKASKPMDKVYLIAEQDSIIVRDCGIGIPKEEQNKILEPFYMVDKSRSRKNGGAGLGLALSVLILKKHNMGLEIESEENEGCTMRIYNLFKK